MNKKPTPKAAVPGTARKPFEAPGTARKPFEAPSPVTGRKPFEAPVDANADLRVAWLFYILLDSARPVLACKGKVSAMESEELGFLFARILDDLDMPVPAEYSAGDPYQRDDVPLPDKVDFGPRAEPDSEVGYAILNALLTIHVRRIARDPLKLRQLYVTAQADVDTRMQYRYMLGEMARRATRMPGAH